MGDLLAGLRPGETFNILFFSGGSETLAPHPLPATPANIRHAMAMMRNYQGGGGTELLPALRHALDMPRTPSQARNIVVVTDGYVGVEREAYDLIRENLNSANVFAFGIGGSVNRYLIESLAHAGAGVPFVVTNPSEAADVAARFRRYISAPLLSDVALSGEGVELYDMEPATIPVMLGERPVVIFGKYRPGARPGRLLLQGRGAHGTYRASMSLAQADVTRDAELLPLLWARQRVKRLADMAGNDVVARRDEIVELGLKYSILTPFTSFIAVDEVVANPKGSAEDVQQALPLPHGVSELALGQPVPEPGDFWMIALLVIACTLAWRRKAAWSAGR
jgi:Ca-activated chloride channel family protein